MGFLARHNSLKFSCFFVLLLYLLGLIYVIMLQGLIRFCVLVYKMASATLRRRLHHGDVDGRKYERYDATDSETLSEPLLRSSSDSKDAYNEVSVSFSLEEHFYALLSFVMCLLGAYSGGYLGRRTEETASSLDVYLF